MPKRIPKSMNQQAIVDSTNEHNTVSEPNPPVTDIEVRPKKKILFVASEATPFIATGGLAEVIGSLSKSIAKNEDYDVRVVIQLY